MTGGYKGGYTPSGDLLDLAVKSRGVNTMKSVALMGGDQALIYGSALVGASAFAADPLLGAAVTVPLLGLIARGQRGLECMVHDASHSAVHQSKRKPADVAAIVEAQSLDGERKEEATLNDTVTDLVAAIPVMSTVKSFRESHMRHHKRFGVPSPEALGASKGGNIGAEAYDPDLERYRTLGLTGLNWSSPSRLLIGIARRLPRYSVDWFRTIGSGKVTLARWAVWHLTAFSLLMVTTSAATALVATVLVVASLLFALPVLRIIGEAQEHDYDAGDTQFQTTISNTGFINTFLHPHGDAHHAEHHVFPKVPGHRLGKLAAALVAGDPNGWGRLHLRRTSLAQVPRQGHR